MQNFISCLIMLLVVEICIHNLCLIGICTGCSMFCILVSIFHLHYNSRLQKLTNAMDDISKRIMESDLDYKEEFLKHYEGNSKMMTFLTKYSFIFAFMTPLIYLMFLPVMEWYASNYRAHLPLPIMNFFNDRLPGVYEFITMIISVSISFSGAIKSTYDCFFISLLKIQTIFFKYLHQTQSVIGEELSRDESHIQNNFLEWIKLHQEVVKNNEDLVQTFSPVIIIYYLIVIEIVVCGAFVQSKSDNDNLVQSIIIASYVLITILYYFLLCNTADELAIEAEKLVFAEYTLPWYQMKKRNISMLKLILTMSNKPVQITAYKAPVFLLSREIFVGFMVAAGSTYLTFCKMGSSSDMNISSEGVVIN